ncbi:hypothetical protein [Rhizobium sp. BG4]|uniref:hypothetical protein n=1 Tax=Rhizobium sp. BG4 TaxID=2613770 RepID=UPI00193E27BD|nr:hypothetical protein [Rhizobium sp. BG4]QRM43966.1 hypothetical protein F2982_11200 [Rhizobium sp. BG4]
MGRVIQNAKQFGVTSLRLTFRQTLGNVSFWCSGMGLKHPQIAYAVIVGYGCRGREGSALTPKRPDIPNFSPFNSVKLGSGVLGKTAPVMVAFLIMMAIAIWRIPESGVFFVTGLAVLAAALVAAYVFVAFRYAERNPGAAVLEGLHLVKYQQNEIAASDPRIIDISPEGAQNSPPPTKNTIQDG